MSTSAVSAPRPLDSYPAGHHKAVLASHLSRTAQNSAAHLLPHLRPVMSILDVGAGPGTITTSFAAIVGPSGKVVGLDASEDVIRTATETAGDRYPNVSFQAGDALHLPFEDDSFDVVHAHQVLAHTARPVEMLKEMRRVAKKSGGVVSLREGDLLSITLWPILPRLERFFPDLYMKTVTKAGGDPCVGRKLQTLLRQAGFSKEEVSITAGTHLYGPDPAEAAWWGESWAGRVAEKESGFYKTALKDGLANQEDLEAIAEAWREWGRSEDAWFAMLNGQAICQLSS